jgi:hypothetical protein
MEKEGQDRHKKMKRLKVKEMEEDSGFTQAILLKMRYLLI